MFSGQSRHFFSFQWEIFQVFADGSVLSGVRYINKATETVISLNRKIREDIRLENAVMLPFGGGVAMIIKK